MAFNDYETSRNRGKPVMLYYFVYGVEPDGTTPIYLAYTDGESQVAHGGITYEPLAVKSTRIESSGKMDTNEVRLTVPRNCGIAELFRIYPPGRVVSVTIRQGHLANDDDPGAYALGENFPVVWLGRVLESSRDGAEATLTCEAASVSMKRSGLRRHYQWPCPLVLYGARCQANKVTATTTATVATITGNRLTLNEPWQKQVPEDPEADPIVLVDIGASNYVGGLVEWQGEDGPEQRAILRVTSAGEIVLNGPAFDLDVADEVDVILGCPHTLSGCETLHDNVVNYGGQPFIPTYNPVGKNNHT
jgi:hypothetical protein